MVIGLRREKKKGLERARTRGRKGRMEEDRATGASLGTTIEDAEWRGERGDSRRETGKKGREKEIERES